MRVFNHAVDKGKGPGDEHAKARGSGKEFVQQTELLGHNVKMIMVEPYFDLRTPNSIAAATGGAVLVMMPSVGGVKEITNYFELFDYDINLLTSTFAKMK